MTTLTENAANEEPVEAGHVWTSGKRGRVVIRAILLGGSRIGGYSMTHYVGLDVSQRMTAICIVDEAGHRL